MLRCLLAWLGPDAGPRISQVLTWLYLIEYNTFHRVHMAPRETVAMRIRELRNKRGWSQEMLAERAGLSRTYLARLETARQDPTLSTLEKIAKALRVKVSVLVD